MDTFAIACRTSAHSILTSSILDDDGDSCLNYVASTRANRGIGTRFLTRFDALRGCRFPSCSLVIGGKTKRVRTSSVRVELCCRGYCKDQGGPIGMRI